MNATVKYLSKVEAKVVRKHKTTVIEQCLSEIVNHNGRLTQEMILTEAENEKHPLHEYFVWDDSVAGHKYRLAQATAMILSTRFVCFLTEKRTKGAAKDAIEGAKDATQVRRYLPDFKNEGFRERPDVLGDAEARRAVIERKISTLRSWCRSVVDIEELRPTCEGILALID